MAAMKLDRILLKLLAVRPELAGFTLARLALIAGRSRGMRAGSSLMKCETRFTDDTRSRRRVAERVLFSTARITSARCVCAEPAADPTETVVLDFVIMAWLLVSGLTELVSGGQVVTGADFREFYHIIQQP